MSFRCPSLHAAALAAVLAGVAPAAADVVLPSVISGGMVLQRETDAPIWGRARPGERVVVEADWEGGRAEAVADERGRWRVALPTPAAGGPYTVRVSGRNTLVLDDVLIGEVWLCSGQSNMEWPLRAAADATAEIANAAHPEIRLFTVANTHATMPRIDAAGAWSPCGPETAARFSAVGYFFGRELHETLGVPIGLISADWGGTVAEAWMSRTALEAFPHTADALAHLEIISDPIRRVGVVQDRREDWWNGLDVAAPGGPGWRRGDPALDDWKTMQLPATLAGDGLESFDGIVYFRRTVDVPPALAGAPALLELGPIDDYDDAWVNDQRVGGTHEPGRWNQPRQYEVPAGVLRPGANEIAVRVLDTGGPGGVNGGAEQMVLRSHDGAASVPLAGAWRYARGAAAGDLPPQPQGATVDQNTPSVLYNGMIAPLVPYAMQGVIWYQGESNRRAPERYEALFTGLIEDWRERWGGRVFPFYFVQIAPYRYGGDRGEAAAVREAQRRVQHLPRTGMVVTTDIGDPADIHPVNKQDVGHRLARRALADTYGHAVVPAGPNVESVRVEGDRIRVGFGRAARGLELRPTPRPMFAIAGAHQRFTLAEARVEGESVVVSSPDVPRPVAVRYGWEATPQASLFGADDLPASPFRTDDWSISLPVVDNERVVAACRTAESGFRDLFNGRDLAGWVNVNGAPSTWRAEDGMIVCSGVPTGVLRTEGMYENFVLELEWRHLEPGGNAGLFVWSDPLTAPGQPFTRSVEVQVMDGRETDWYTSDGDIFPIHGAVMKPENGRGGSRGAPTERRTHPAPLWNHYRVECRDGDIALAINGKVVTRGRACRPRKGYLCLESEGSPVHFRNIRLQEHPPGPRMLVGDDVAREAEGFTPLYNGVDFTGWKLGPEHVGHWRANDWTIDYDGGGADLWTARSFRDFVLVCDWRWTGTAVPQERPVILPDGSVATDAAGAPKSVRVPDAGDSGIYLRGSSKSQVNIWCWPVGSGEVYGYRTDASMPPEVRAGVTPRLAADAPIGKWNRFVITMRGERLTVVLNGKTVIEDARLPGVAPEGPIALQQHGGALQFANVYVRELRD